MVHATPATISKAAACLALLALSAMAVFAPISTAQAAYSQPVTWEDMSALDLRPAFRSQYASTDNLMDPTIKPSDVELVLRDADARVSSDFHVPEALKPAVAFWLQIYTQYTTQHVVIFDSRHPEIIYDVLDLRELARTSRNRMAYEIVSKKRIQRAVDAYRRALAHLARNPNPRKPTREEQNILAVTRRLAHKHPYAELRRQIKCQTGQRDNIIKGLLAAETFFPKMEQIFAKMGVPLELTRLTLVESSFNLSARSKVGASGIWQFMPKSGKEFLRIDERTAIDERLSPLKATVAAGKLLRRNHRILGHWALAVTSFNHGFRGLPRQEEDDSDFGNFAHLFDSCTKKHARKALGYASRNYYAEYLAVLHAEAYRNLFYGAPPTEPVQPVGFFRVAKPQTALQIAQEHSMPIQRFKLYNPDVINLRVKLPRGFLVAIPGENDDMAMLTEHALPRKTSDI